MSGIAAVQARIAELRQLVEPQAATTSTGSSTSTGSTTDATFAATLAALGVDSTQYAALTGQATTATSGAATGQGLVEAAKKYLGVPYVWGGETLDEGGLDCSGLVLRAMTDLGVGDGVPRVARQQMTMGTPVASLDQALPGDLVVFGGGTHIGIYMGDGKMIDAPRAGSHVQIRDVYTTPTAIRRVLPQEAATTVDPSAALSAALSTATAQRNVLSLLAGTGVAS
ncbi:C40 family peptidase [Cellulomonas cellasea]|uniref:C40 family peptidase n=1 Tax=Cellulomonas cellasea TaxID=43670 RepID=UPI0025A36969|nr:C40 family peptidase [Cellulomonas cellasea]MDM8083387.1 C40 family peptidase [Cellulomonas cellasea]